jgi:predicted Fe-Mo cluster-binding NifX family protein
MKVAFTEWHGRIAPLFDVAQTVLMVETVMSDTARKRIVRLPLETPETKVTFLVEQEVDVLVCGAISRQVREMAEADGIKVYPFIAGEIRDVVDAWMSNRLDQMHYSMPGCRRCRQKLRQRNRSNNK